MLVLLMPTLEYCITVFHASLLCIMQQLGEGLPLSLAVQLTYRCMCSNCKSNLVHTGYVFCGTLVIKIKSGSRAIMVL